MKRFIFFKGNINNFGFTIIELLIVIVLIGILASTIVFRINNVTETTEKRGLNTTAYSLKKAIELHLAETNKLPEYIDGKLNFSNSIIDFNLSQSYKLDNYEYLDSDNKKYKIKVYKLDNTGNETDKLAIVTDEEIILNDD